MSWEDRLREAAYTSPKGTRLVFQYTDVGRSIPLRNAAFDFPGVDDSYVQPNGYSSRQYPMRCYFSGPNCDLQATAFEKLLIERGVGLLEHPLYGTFEVVPYGEISRTDALTTAANQSVVETTFWTTVGAIYPSSQVSPTSSIINGLDNFNNAAASQFATQTVLAGAIAQANTKATVRGFLSYVSAALSAASSATSSVNNAFRADQAAINGGIDVLIGQPLQLALQITNLIQDPSRAASGIASRLLSYRNLANTILGTVQASNVSDATLLSSLLLKVSNDFHTCDLFAFIAVSGSVSSALNNTFATKPQALSAAAEIANQLTTVVSWRDGRFGGLGQVDPGGSYQALQQLVALTLGYLVESSFSLATERRIILDRPRTIVDLCAELYGSVDDKLDFMIDTNALSGAEILEMPAGRSVVFYV
jgi:hypothetical protein